MPEIPSRTPEPQRNDDAALLGDIVQASEDAGVTGSVEAKDSAAMRSLLPNLPAREAEAVLGSLRDAGALDRLLALVRSPTV